MGRHRFKNKKQTESLVDIGDPLVINYGFDDLNNVDITVVELLTIDLCICRIRSRFHNCPS